MVDFQRKKEQEISGPLSNPVQDLAFKAIKNLATPKNELEAYTLASTISKLAGLGAFPLAPQVAAMNMIGKVLNPQVKGPTGQFGSYSGSDVEDQYSGTISQDPMSSELVGALSNDVGDYAVSDLPGSYESQVKAAIQESFSRVGNNNLSGQSNVAKTELSNKITESIKEAIAKSNPAGAIPGDYSPLQSSITKTEVPSVDGILPTSLSSVIPTVDMTIDLSDVFNSTDNNTPVGYESYSGEDVEASYPASDSGISGQSSGNWGTTASHTSSAGSPRADASDDSGSRDGGK